MVRAVRNPHTNRILDLIFFFKSCVCMFKMQPHTLGLTLSNSTQRNTGCVCVCVCVCFCFCGSSTKIPVSRVCDSRL